VSLDSLDPEIYANTRGADLAKVVENIQHLIRLAPSTVNIDISLMNSNVQAVSEKESRLFHETFGTHENVKLHRVENGLFPLADADFRVNPSKTGSCFTTACYLPVMWDGRVALCCLDQDVQHPLGNLNENSISEVWYNKTNQGILFKLALGEPGCPDYCVQHCVMTIDPAVHKLSDSEIRVWRAQKLLQIANTISEEYKYFGLDPEFFIQRARDIAPSDLELGKKEEDDCQQSYQANFTGNDQVRSENFLKTSFAFLVRKLSK